MTKSSPIKILPALVVLMTGLIPWHFTFKAWNQSRTLIANTVSVQGTVVDYDAGYQATAPKHSALLYYPVVEFKDPSGRIHRLTSGVGRGKKRYTVGDPVTVRYDPQNRQAPIVESFARLWAKSALFALVGLPFVLLGGVRIFQARGRADPT